MASGRSSEPPYSRFQPLAGQNALEGGGQALILAEHVADLAAADADIARRHVDIRADMAVELGHEALAEFHDLVLAAALGVEVRAALAAAHGKPGERVLEGLLEAEEFEHALVDRRVEADAALVGADGVVELHPVAPVHMQVVVVVGPGDAEADNPVGLRHALQHPDLRIDGVLLDERDDRPGDFVHRLVELALARIAGHDPVHEVR